MMGLLRNYFSITFLIVVSNILPHFQNPSKLSWVILEAFFVLVCWATLSASSISNFIPRSAQALSIYGAFLLLILYLLNINMPFIYNVWSHFGAGPMILRDQIIPFGDLAHLTSAAKCPLPIKVGDVVCDPWGRNFNQNPYIPRVMRFLHLNNLELIGITTLCVFLLVLYISLKFENSKEAITIIAIFTPPLVLAFERGNEVITMIFIITSILLFRTKNQNLMNLGACALILASLFKVWPTAIGLILICAQGKRMAPNTRLILITPGIFWFFNWREVLKIAEETQHGSPHGGSFGLKILLNSNLLNLGIYISLIIVTLTYLFFTFRLHRKFSRDELKSTEFDVLTFSISIMMTFFLLWFVSDSFMYRLIMLLPLLVFFNSPQFSQYEWARDASKFTVICLISSKLMLSSAITSALALYLFHLSIMLLFSVYGYPTSKVRRK